MSDKQHFETGAQRDTNEGKSRFDLMTPFIEKRLGELLRKGAEYYGANNWLSGIPNSRYWESFRRHANSYAMGMKNEDHLAAAIWNLCGIMHNEEVAGTDTEIQVNGEWRKLPKELLDFPIFRQVIAVGMDTGNGKDEDEYGMFIPCPSYKEVQSACYISEIRDLKNMLDETPVNEAITHQSLKDRLENVEAQYKKFKEGVK